MYQVRTRSKRILGTPENEIEKGEERSLLRIKDVYARHCSTSRGRAKFGRPSRSNLERLCVGTRCNQEGPPGAMVDMDVWQERVRELYVSSMT